MQRFIFALRVFFPITVDADASARGRASNVIVDWSSLVNGNPGKVSDPFPRNLRHRSEDCIRNLFIPDPSSELLSRQLIEHPNHA
jgi:hypothetical protein